MVSQDSLLVTLVNLVNRLPLPVRPMNRGRGRPQIYSESGFPQGTLVVPWENRSIYSFFHQHYTNWRSFVRLAQMSAL
jgi:hypothetical protein